MTRCQIETWSRYGINQGATKFDMAEKFLSKAPMQTETPTYHGNQAVNRLTESNFRLQRELQEKDRRERRILQAVRQAFGPDGFDMIQRILSAA